MKCPHCGIHLSRYGFSNSGKQRYRCYKCKYYSKTGKRSPYARVSDEKRQEISRQLELYDTNNFDKTLKQIAIDLKVSRSTLLRFKRLVKTPHRGI